MLNGPLLHPDILRVLARSGHHSKVLIADGNYPALNKRGPRAELVSLQLVPGVPTVAQVFEAVLAAVQIDEVFTIEAPGFICLTAARVILNIAPILVSKVLSHSSSLIASSDG